MAFDVDAYRAARPPWAFTLDGVQYTSRRITSAHLRRYHQLLSGPGNDEQRLATALAWLLRCAVPWRPSFLWRGDPARKLLRLNAAARDAALLDFFATVRRDHASPTATAP
jgi:hypothetical protein